MIGISFFRVTKAALRNFRRNFWLSLATTVIMAITLIMVSFLYFANVLGSHILSSIEDKVDLSATFKDGVTDDQIRAVSNDVKTRQDVKDVHIVTSEDALATFRDKHKDDPFIDESLKELEKNPLPANMYIVASDPRSYQAITQQLESDKYSAYIAKVSFENSRAVIDNLIKVMDRFKNFGIIVTVIFSLLVILIMFSTIRLAIYSFREEIDIMRLVGASNWFIQGPFVIEAMFVAILGIILCNAIILPTLNSTTPYLRDFFFTNQGTDFSLFDYALNHWITLLGLQLALAVTLAVVSSMIAVRRYLRR